MPDTMLRRVNALATTTPPAAETVIATIVAPSTTPGLQTINLDAEYTVTTAAATTGVTLRIRRDSITGSLVGAAVADGIFAAAAGGTETHNISVQDNRGDCTGAVYALTAQHVGAGGNSTAVQVALSVSLGT